MSARHAIYLAPEPGSALWSFGSRVLGYDAATGEDVDAFALPGIDAERWRAIAARPRGYGFHATLKAPFRLAEGLDAAGLQPELARFAAARTAFSLGPLAVTSLKSGEGGFVALTPRNASPELAELEAEVVKGFDRFRAPLTADERAARRPDRLSERERMHLDRYGYPHVLEDFRFHMTLTGFVPNPDDLADALAEEVANRLGSVHLTVAALFLFEQAQPGARFRIVGRAPFRTPASGSAPA